MHRISQANYAFPSFVHAGEATATGGDITLKGVQEATWDARAQWYILAINLDVDKGTIDVTIACMIYVYMGCVKYNNYRVR